MNPSLTKRAKRMTTKPAATLCVLVTTVCWYASSVTAAPRHPIRNPLRFRSMPPPLVASRPRSQLLFGFFARMLLRVETTKRRIWELGWGWPDGDKKPQGQRLRRWSGEGPRSQLMKDPEGRAKSGKRRFGMSRSLDNFLLL
ncbi:hypothetical protein ZEAMMB73_Zm00001d025612 [Zea mays]|uniref:Uncharacterized protein n=1 Tax=Zea mays TaxID=4577 RepID=K7TL00_MAIZE|nr:hypothetical protein ZEAMMB73_Zm00001d025612 [Zea mays]